MPSTELQVFPRGLLGFFQLKAGGSNPKTIGELLQPVLPLEEWYFTSEAGGLRTAPLAVAAVGFTALFALGAQAQIRSLGFSIQSAAALGAGVSFQIACAMRVDPNGAAAIIQIGPTSPIFTVGHLAACYSDRHVFVPPNAELGVLCSVLAAGPVNVVGNDFRAILST